MNSKITAIRNIVSLLDSRFPMSLPCDPRFLVSSLGGECVSLTAREAAETGYPPEFEAKAVKPVQPYTFRIEYADWKPKESIRFAIAHELGFLLLYLLQLDGTIPYPKSQKHRTSEETFYADEFAAELLMPVVDFSWACKRNAENNEGKINVDDIAATFGVTKSAALVRGSRLGIW